MLVLTRKLNEVIWIGEDIRIMVIGMEQGQVKLGISADPNIRITRDLPASQNKARGKSKQPDQNFNR